MTTSAETLRTSRLVLSPLRVSDAKEMFGVLSDSDLYTFTGEEPPPLAQLESRYRSQVAGSPTATEIWHNWIMRLVEPATAVGFVRATVVDESADVAWVVAVDWQGQGLAQEAAGAMCEWLAHQSVTRLTGHIHRDHGASNAVAASIGLRPTDEVDSDGEIVWASA